MNCNTDAMTPMLLILLMLTTTTMIIDHLHYSPFFIFALLTSVQPQPKYRVMLDELWLMAANWRTASSNTEAIRRQLVSHSHRRNNSHNSQSAASIEWRPKTADRNWTAMKCTVTQSSLSSALIELVPTLETSMNRPKKLLSWLWGA